MFERLCGMQECVEIASILVVVAVIYQKRIAGRALHGRSPRFRGGGPSEMGAQATSNSTSIGYRTWTLRRVRTCVVSLLAIPSPPARRLFRLTARHRGKSAEERQKTT